ncbi:MAG: helix-turn-helix domain-containing protein [Rickettsiales bacterium]|jgi:DNA-binding XRE family transcriptional regulator|nr:helix-turn-helix domain-containing protein [Rickettsiales bacterium]
MSRRKIIFGKEIVGNNVKKYRSLNNLTLDKLSVSSGLTKGFLSMLERGKSNLTKDTAMILSKILRCEVQDLYSNSNLENIQNNNFKYINSNYNTSTINNYKTTNDGDENYSKISFYDSVVSSVDTYDTMLFDKKFFKKIGIDGGDTIILQINNNEYYPELEKGDYIFVDTKNKNLKRGFILFIRRK